MSLPLADAGVLVTRPAHQAAGLCAALRAAGAQPIAFPTLAIGPPTDAAAFAAALDQIPDSIAAVFVSANAVSAAAPWLAARGRWPAGVACLAVGPASAQALREAGVAEVHTPPDRHDSEGLLALPALDVDRVTGRTVVVVRGAGGRPLLAQELAHRGARVVLAEGYTRTAAPADPAGPAVLGDALRAGTVRVVTVTSRACLAGLLAACPPEHRAALTALPLAVLAPALADAARAAGWQGVVVPAAQASDAALVTATAQALVQAGAPTG